MKLMVLILIWSASLLADAKRVVVKVGSGLCNSSTTPFQGSGIAFRHQGKNYAITSEHVVLHGNGRFCHRVWSQELGILSASLISAEYGNGLALLEFKTNKNNGGDIPDLEEIATVKVKSGDSVSVIGFAYGLNELIDNSGEVLLAKSQRKMIPLVSEVIETKSAHGEFGMSGGPVFSKKGEFVGVLSHQFVKLLPGQRSKVEEYSQGLELQNHLLIIPGETVISWVEGVLSQGHVAFFKRDPEAQLKKREVILAGGLRFETIETVTVPKVEGVDELEGKLKGIKGAGGSDDLGFQSEDSFGEVGGADGVGAGGSDELVSSVAVKITMAESEESSVWGMSEQREWVKIIKEELRLPWNHIEVPFFLETEGEIPQAVATVSLAHFFQSLTRESLEPVTLIHSVAAGVNKENENLDKLKEQSQKLATAIASYQNKTLAAQPEGIIKRARLISYLLNKEAWQYLRVSQIKELTDMSKQKECWKPLFDESFDDAVGLLEALIGIQDLLTKLKK